MTDPQQFLGVGTLADQPSRRVLVVIELIAGYVVISNAEGERLRSWPSAAVKAKPVDDRQVILSVGGERLSFETVDPVGFITALEAISRSYQEMPSADRMQQAARMGTVTRGAGQPGEQVGEITVDVSESEPVVSVWTLLEENSAARGAQEASLDGGDLTIQEDPFAEVLALVGTTHQSEPPVDESDHPVVDEPGSSLLHQVEEVQPEVVDWLLEGMKAWFGFYFATAEGSGKERLERAVVDLRQASVHLAEVSAALTTAVGESQDGAIGLVEAASIDTAAGYAAAVEEWSRALESLAEGIELDQRRSADDGLRGLVDAAINAQSVVRSPLYPTASFGRLRGGAPSLVADPLTFLQRLSPHARVPSDAVRRAKQPWEMSLIGAGSPLRWTR